MPVMPFFNKQLLRHLRLAICAASLVLAACSTTTGPIEASQRLHLRDTARDFAELGLGPTIAKHEDGRRTPQSTEFFEWWYVDGHLDDGTVVVVWFGDNWLYGSNKRTVSIEVTPPGEPTRKFVTKLDDAGSFAKDHAAIKIGPHTFEGDLDTYAIHIDATAAGGMGCDLLLHRRVPSYRPATGHLAASDKFFAWVVAVPEGKISGTLTMDNTTRTVAGSGYHDHNWGNVSPADLFEHWWWGRGVIGKRTVIASAIRAKPAFGGDLIPIMFVGDEQKVEVNTHGETIAVQEGAALPHPDPKHKRLIGSSVSLTLKDGTNARFNTSKQMLKSTDLLEDRAFPLQLAAQAFGVYPWYTRFLGPMSLTLPGQAAMTGVGTLEYFEMR